MTRTKMTFEHAKAMYVHRFTCEHVPQWAKQQRADGTYYAPQYASCLEWWSNTIFPGQPEHWQPRATYCISRNQSWPHGKFLKQPYRKVRP